MNFIDLAEQYKILKVDINKVIQEVLEHGQYIMGKEVQELEKILSEYLKIKHVITCANGTDALQMLCMAYNIGEGDAVFSSDLTFVASLEPACMLGAKPVFCDIEKDTYNLCLDSLERQINNVIKEGIYRPKAVIAVDILGNPADYDKLNTLCDKYNMILIEDAAQSFGSTYKGQKCGTFGHSAITSFFPAKPLGCYGDGGAIFTNDDDLAEVLNSIRVHGKGESKYDNVRIGVNSRLDTIQAAILKVKFKAFTDYEINNRIKIANRYNEAFKDVFKTPYIEEGSTSVYAQYVLLSENEEQRSFLLDKLNCANIPNMVYYPKPQHMLDVYKNFDQYNEEFKNAKEYCSRTFSIPMHPYLSYENQNKIIKTLLEAVVEFNKESV